MNSNQANRKPDAFTLVELLCVIAIISILAALIMAAANQAQSRGRRIGCISHLQQLGVAFQLFMHDHDGRFPMAVPMAEGGSLEFVRNGFAVGGEFYFSYRHFQTLSNELVLAKMLICPTDTRLPAASFPLLQNSNVSYFVGVKAEFSAPESILAGDRNLTANSSPNPSILHGAADNRMWWTRELHQFKGNILFADGHVEEWNNAMLATGAGAQLAGADLVMPTSPAIPGAPVPGHPGYGATGPGVAGYQNYSGASPVAETPPPMASPAPAPAPARAQNSLSGTQQRSGRDAAGQPDLAGTNSPSPVATNAPGRGRITVTEMDLETATFDQRLVIILRRVIIGFYLLILLILVLWYLLSRWQRAQRRNRQVEDGH